eukprot:3639375-Pleurochrysis_carterae.AAC.2
MRLMRLSVEARAKKTTCCAGKCVIRGASSVHSSSVRTFEAEGIGRSVSSVVSWQQWKFALTAMCVVIITCLES